MSKSALGKGLSALIPDKVDIFDNKTGAITRLKASLIKDNSFQPRTDYNDEKLNELKASIQEKGILQPILVREKNGGYEIIAGERRLRAARALNFEEVPVIVKNVTDQEALVIALVENIQREELNAIEEAEAYKKLIEDFGYSHESVAKSVGKDRSTITNLLRLLKLPSQIQKSIYDGALSVGHARALLGLENSTYQNKLYENALAKGWSVRELEDRVRDAIIGHPRREKSKKAKDHEIVSLEEDLQKALGTKVQVISKKKKGKIIIEYYSLDDLDRIIGIIKR